MNLARAWPILAICGSVPSHLTFQLLLPQFFSLLAPRLICGRVYKQLNEQMDFLWGGDLRINTVHVNDVVRAVWHSANWYVSSDNTSPGAPVIFNLADGNDTSK